MNFRIITIAAAFAVCISPAHAASIFDELADLHRKLVAAEYNLVDGLNKAKDGKETAAVLNTAAEAYELVFKQEKALKPRVDELSRVKPEPEPTQNFLSARAEWEKMILKRGALHSALENVEKNYATSPTVIEALRRLKSVPGLR